MRDAMKETMGEMRETLDISDELAAVKRSFRDEEPEWVVWLTVLAALVLGLILMWAITGQARTAQAGNTTVSYPANWQQYNEQGANFAAYDLSGGGTFGSRVSEREVDKAELLPRNVTGAQANAEADLQTAAANWALQRQNDLVGYRTLGVVTTTLGSKLAIQVENAYLLDSNLGGGGVPGLMRGVDTIVMDGDRFDILSFAAESNRFDSLKDLRERLVRDWNIP